MTVQSDKLRELFLAALKVPAGERDAFLRQACAGADEMCERVKLLIQAHEELGSIAPSAEAEVGPTIDQPMTETAGTVIGPYKLLEQIGEGGMGTVWMAEQTEPIQRRVALKVIKEGMDSKQVLARFEAERQALALMEHPNIAKVLDAGKTPSGRPYFVMELVKGKPITTYCDEKRLAVRERLELFGDVCRAVQHAHQKGIIHRDLKPSNVLVAPYDGKAVVKVIDFGVAKATGQRLTDKTLFTGFGALVGTPEYMSPEQAEVNNQDIDTRSDIYSLGVLLYELLTGSTPLTRKRIKEAALLEVLRVIREEEPPKPSTRLSTTEELPSVAANRGLEPARLTKLVRGELDWIVMKALEKDRNRRYETANGFAMDVQRYLADEPVQACPPSAWYRFRKFARRNKARLTVAGLILFFVVVVGSGGGWIIRDRAAREEASAKERLDREQRLTAQAEQILDKVDRLEREQKWPEALAAAKRAEAALAGGEADDAIRQRVADARRGLAFVARLDRIRQDRGFVLLGMPDPNPRRVSQDYPLAFREYGVDVAALPPEQAVAGLQTNPALAVPVAAALDDWAADLREPGEDPMKWKPLVAVARRLDPDPLRDRLRAVWGQPITPDLQADLRRLAEAIDVKAQSPATIELLAVTLIESHLPDPAVRLLRDGQYAYPADFWLNTNLGAILRQRKEYAGAVRYFSVAVGLRPESAPALLNLGHVLAGQKKLDEAIACYQAAIGIDPTYTPAHASLGKILADKGMLPEAIASCRKAIELDPNSAVALNNLGSVLALQGKSDEAIVCLRKAIALDPTYAAPHHNLSIALRQQKKLDEALAECRRGIDLDPQWAMGYSNLGEVFRDKRMLTEAVANCRKAIELDPSLPDAHYCLGNAFLAQKKPDEASACYRKALELNPKYADAHVGLGSALADKKDLGGAIREFRAALELDPNNVYAHYNLGEALSSQNNLEGAIREFQATLKINPNFATAHNNLGNALAEKKDLEGAIREYRLALKIDPNDALPHNNLGSALHKKKDLEGAIREFEAALRINPNFAAAHHNLGHTLRGKGDLEGAIRAYRAALKIDPNLAEAHTDLGVALYEMKDLAGAIRAYRNAIKINPNYAAAHNNLGNALCVRGEVDEGIREFHLALKIDPNYATAHLGLGTALNIKGLPDEAIVHYRKALAIGLNDAEAEAGTRYSLGVILRRQGMLEEAVTEYQQAIRLKKDFAEAHCSLGVALQEKGEREEAIKEYREALRLDPKRAHVHYNLGLALNEKGEQEEAIKEFREAIHLDPKNANAHWNLGVVLSEKGEQEKAIKEYREAIHLDPNLAEAHCNLGHVLRQQGQFAEALAELTRGHELGSKRPDWRYPSAQWVREAEQFVALDAKLQRVLKGEAQPADSAEQLALAKLCQEHKKLNAAAARFYEEAFAAEPKLVAPNRYNAACVAALAGCGQGKDADHSDAKERTRLRRQALDWLRADLAAWGRLLGKEPKKTGPVLAETMQRWQQDTDFAGVRGPEALAKLTEPERQEWQKLWNDVTVLLSRAQAKAAPEKK
jgi:tetratricopeptide (TPR) repeat protein/serine/threonine protein kinase